ncbi:MAG: ComEC/Rec2 family competence protein, partial [Endomicrobiia bacterium]|nr:ComEC/Rec2 family competence protein [Endomicrobiia bacterium]
LLNLLARRVKIAALIACCAAFVAAGANYYRVVDITSPSHITNFYDAAFFDKTIVRGTVIADPDIRDGFTNIDIKPSSIIPDPVSQPANVIKLEGKTGYLRAKIYPTIGNYYYALSYGDFVELTTSINKPMPLKNPAGFDYAAYLRARNIYASARPIRNSDEIKYLGTGNISWLWRVALGLKKQILLTIRKTMPYPESAFLGGVTLGLRGGVPGKIKSDFQATGVGHVLAVSGLHVGFVAVMLIMMAKVFKLPSRFSFIFVVFGLIIFTLITGASPATRRAAIMFSMMVFFRDVMKMSLGHSTALTIPTTAFILLALDPLKLPEASFVLSFMAVWSLAMITAPVENVFKFLGRGWIFAVTIALILGSTAFVIVAPGLFSDSRFVYAYVAAFIALYVFAYFREKTNPLSSLNIEHMPKWFTSFFYAQFAIQIGMMYPLSAVYFQRFPIAGMYANFIAIPLIAFIVQYGLLAGLANVFFSSVGLPAVGISVALWINAFNWLCCKAFLVMAAFFARLFPYPYISMPTPAQLVLYYTGVILFVFMKPLSFQIRMLIMRLRDVFDERELKRRAIPAAVAAAVLVAAGIIAVNASKKDYMRVTFFDVSFGNSVLIETPDGKTILFDTGQGGGAWNSGSSVIAPTLAKYKISRINWLIFSSLKPNNIGGTPHILNYWPVDKVLLPYNPQNIP